MVLSRVPVGQGCVVRLAPGRKWNHSLDEEASQQVLTQITQRRRKATDYTERIFYHGCAALNPMISGARACHISCSFLCNPWLFFFSI